MQSNDCFNSSCVRAIFSTDLDCFSKTPTAITNSASGINQSVTFLGIADAKYGFLDLDATAPGVSSMQKAEAVLLTNAGIMPAIDVYHQETKDLAGKIDPIVAYGEAKLFASTQKINRNKVKLSHAVVDCYTVPKDNVMFRAKWKTGILGDGHNGRLINCATQQKISRGSRSFTSSRGS